MENPLVVTLKLEEAVQQKFTALRNEHFPAHVNYLDAHLTLFHALPSNESKVFEVLEEMSRRPLLEMDVSAVKNMGTGVSYLISSSELQEMHRTMQQKLDGMLINQDRPKLQPHVTIQNKVTAFKALSLYKKLNEEFRPFPVSATGISCWLYLKGPWQHVKDFNFLKG